MSRAATAVPATGIPARTGAHKRRRSLTLEVRTLQDKRTRCEQGILKLSGAARLAEEQYQKVIDGHACSLCKRADHAPEAAKLAEGRLERTLDMCEKTVSNYLSKHRSCITELAMLTGKSQLESTRDKMHTDEWCSFEFKKGKVATLREQKVQSLKAQSCVVCGSKLTNLAHFLSSVDRQVCALESELHVHSNGL
ncbi:Hypothetical Protein FCC1311_005112 [Hondaea fermentalgiana]|uniref:Uncharacterized protein n=1 Tax=Hondaea fermentalgiana TaxID=2315210 RepID=A0A2R5G762_9STRA|nr:Hypothetical Protein FCC1311_005112 [Hondaea fermentalgiana]|eukprot:GBG24293.1 Hypothetical Protein FCC1311_005112 [Hondaea fermentalgiana]